MTDRLLIEAGWVVPMDPSFSVIRDGAVLVEGSRVVAVGASGEIDRDGAEVRRFPRHVLLPGIVNGHTHVAGAVYRGLLEDRPNHFYGFALPMERYLGADEIYSLSVLGIAELLLSGCTAMNDMFHHSAETARAARDAGIRAQIAHKVFDVDLAGIGQGRRDYSLERGLAKLEENIDLYERWHHAADGRISIRFGAHAADTCSPELQREIAAQANKHGAGIHAHVAQSRTEDSYIRETYGFGSVELLESTGLLGPATIAVHLLFTDERGIDALQRTSTSVAHCPACVTKVAAMLGPLREIYESGIPVGWGTDWVSMDPWDAMRFGIVGLRLVTGDELMLSAREALWRFTVGSARILGWESEIGSLEPGKKADLILVDVDQPHLAPMRDPFAVLVYNASGRDVTHVMIDGEFVVEERRLRNADTKAIVAEGQAVAERVWQAGASPEELALPVPTHLHAHA